MDKKKAMKWVKALRSGKYKQTKGFLRLSNESSGQPIGHCCLGVLAEVSKCDVEELNGMELLEEGSGLQEKCGIRSQEGAPQTSGDDIGYIRIRIKNKWEKVDSLADANDKGATFKSIANWIEKNYKLL